MTVLAYRGRAGTGLTGTALTGTGELARLAVRRDRIALAAAVYVIAVLVAGTAETLKKLYPTAASRAALAATGGGNPALRFLYSRMYGTSLGSITAWRYGIWAGIFAALMVIFVVIRHTRSDEEGGRLELVGSTVVGRQAALAASLATAAGAAAAVTVLLCVLLPLTGLPVAGSALLGLAIGCCALAFTGIAAVAAQLTSSARTARGIALGVLGVAFMLRGVGDAAGAAGPSWLSWLSPLGWIQFTQPFAAGDWWVLSLPLAVALGGTALAFALAARRDQGAGLLPGRPGRATATAALSGPSGLAWRLQRGALLGWAIGYAFTFAASGAAAKGVGQLFGTSSALQREFTRLGGQAAITNAYLAALMLLAGLVAAAYAISVIARLRSEETSDVAEPVLATAAGRIRWALGHIAVAVAGSALLLVVAGLAAGLGYGLRIGSAGSQAATMAGAALAQLPSVLVLAGAATAVFGLWPRACVAAAWTALGLVVVISLFGQVLRVSHWILDLSPFTHAPRLPGGPVSATPLLWLSGLALAAAAAGLAGLRRRDIGLDPGRLHRARDRSPCVIIKLYGWPRHGPVRRGPEAPGSGIALCILSPINCWYVQVGNRWGEMMQSVTTRAVIRPLQRPVPLRQSVYDALIDLIVGGELPPGQHMVETDLARQLGVSRQPIREALHRMEAEGWVDLRPSQGAFVHVPTDSEVDELLDVRALLEAETARLAAQAASPAQVARLREICAKGQAAAETDDLGQAVAANDLFHGEVAAVAGNSVLAELADIVGRRVQWYYRMVAPERAHGSWTEHAELIDAIEAADPEQAQLLARKHTERTRDAYHGPKDLAGLPGRASRPIPPASATHPAPLCSLVREIRVFAGIIPRAAHHKTLTHHGTHR